MNDDVTVLEYGGRWVKGGLALNYPSDEEPRVLTPSAVTIEQSSSPGYDSEAAALAAGATVHRPVRGGKIVSWDQFEALVHYMLYELLGWELGKEGNVLMCEPVLTSRTDRETMSQLMFEAFNVSGLFIQDQAVLSLYAFGRTHGLVVDVGHDKVDVSTVIEGLVNQSSVRRLNYGGADLTRYLQKLMADKPPTQAQPQEQQPRPDSMQVDGEQQQGAPQQEQQQQRPSRPLTAEGAMEALKELCARCCESERALEAACAAAAQQPQSYTLPDGQRFSVGDEGLRVAEALFHPHTLLGVLSPNLVEAALDSASVVPELLMRKVLYENMVVVGGGAVMPGLQQRFLTHMRALVPPSALSSAAVCAVPEYLPDPHLVRHASWMGGGVLAQVALAQGHFLTKADYDEAGPGCVHRRCT